MNKLILAAALAAGCTLVPGAPALAAAKNYDCSKAGNANKAACKGAAASAAAAASKAVPPKAPTAKSAATKVSSTTTTKTVTQKNYDCTKAGNANKAVCKSATASKPVATQTTVATTTRHYDCTKAGNANKAECKVATSSSAATSKPVATTQPSLLQRMKNAVSGSSTPPAKPAAAQPARRTAAPSSASVENSNPTGAIAQCKDGTYSHAKARTGACSRHGGVGKWM